MAVATILPILLFGALSRGRCDSHGFSLVKGNAQNMQYGDILKPPPLPPTSHLSPVPFHGGAGRVPRQNLDVGYQYPPPPPPALPPPTGHSNFKFPSPFYKQYNFNFVPPPQPFTTSPPPSLFNKVSSWLFPPGQNYNSAVEDVQPAKKECHSCNHVPWIPVLRYDLAAKNLKQNVQTAYGAPSPTTNNNLQSFNRFQPQSFQLPQSNQQYSPGVPHETYGPPPVTQSEPPVSTYGPPSPTHTIDITSQNSLSSTYNAPSSSYSPSSSYYGNPTSGFGEPSSLGVTSSTYGNPSSSYGGPTSTYGNPSSSYGGPSSTYGNPSSSYGGPSSSYGGPSPSYGAPSSSYGGPSSTYGPPSATAAAQYDTSFPTTSTFLPVTPSYQNVPNYQPPSNDQVDVFRLTGADFGQQLPKVSFPTGFKNSYGEPITSPFDIPYPVSAAAESTKVKTELLPNGFSPNNYSTPFALSKPSPFMVNKGRNVHSLQPVALPNLSASPLLPIFNARPFRTISPLFPDSNKNSNEPSIKQSVPSSYTHSVNHPPTIIQSPIIDVSTRNQTKGYRNIENGYIIDYNRDISSQASEDHIAATKNTNDINESSFESTGPDAGSDLYDVPHEMKYTHKVPPNHKEKFADLRGMSDDDVDKYRTESNLQAIDSPLLYLKPSAPHKEFDNFITILSTTSNSHDYEIYDDATTSSPPRTTHIWDDSKTNYNLFQQTTANEKAKPKVVQIIIPYTRNLEESSTDGNSDQNSHEWTSASEGEYQARKVPTNSENDYNIPTTETYSLEDTTIDDTNTPEFDDEKLDTPSNHNDIYDVKEPPFDIIKLQQNIDDWTELQYSHYQSVTAKPSTSKFAHSKQIPDEYFTTMSPISNFVTAFDNEEYDSESSGSIQHSVSELRNDTHESIYKPIKEYNVIQRKEKTVSGKSRSKAEKPYIYTAASSFRVTTTTQAPWKNVETSISPLTKEKVYVVTSRPWAENNTSSNWLHREPFESKKTTGKDPEVPAEDNLPFKSPRFLNRPSFESSGKDEPQSDDSYEASRNWHQSINDLDAQSSSNVARTPEGAQRNNITNTAKVTADSTTAGHQNE